MKFNEIIAKRRKELNMTQIELASKLGVSNKVVSKWETGRGLPDVLMMKELSSVLNLDIEDLFEIATVGDVDKYEKKSKVLFLISNIISTILLLSTSILYLGLPEFFDNFFNSRSSDMAKTDFLVFPIVMLIMVVTFFVIGDYLEKKKKYSWHFLFSICSLGSTISFFIPFGILSGIIYSNIGLIFGFGVSIPALFGIGFGLLYVMAGFSLDKAKKINPIFGVRTGFAFKSQENWDVAQQTGKYVFVIDGFICIFGSVLHVNLIFHIVFLVVNLTISIILIYILPKYIIKRKNKNSSN